MDSSSAWRWTIGGGIRTQLGHRSGCALEAWTEAKGALAWLLNTAKGDPERIFQVREGRVQGALVGFALK